MTHKKIDSVIVSMSQHLASPTSKNVYSSINKSITKQSNVSQVGKTD